MIKRSKRSFTEGGIKNGGKSKVRRVTMDKMAEDTVSRKDECIELESGFEKIRSYFGNKIDDAKFILDKIYEYSYKK